MGSGGRALFRLVWFGAVVAVGASFVRSRRGIDLADLPEEPVAAIRAITRAKPMFMRDVPVEEIAGRCDEGDAEACFDLASAYESEKDGWLMPSIPDCIHVPLYVRACDSGYDQACREAERFYASGQCVEKDTVHVETMLHQACRHGDRTACDRVMPRSDDDDADDRYAKRRWQKDADDDMY